MLRLFVDAVLEPGTDVALPPGASRHAQVRRVQPGDAVVMFDGRGGEWSATVTAMGRQTVQLRVGHHLDVDREMPCAVTLAVGMPANERMDILVEKATELGAAVLQPLLCERSVLRLTGERAERKRAHWQALAVAASEQSGRTRVPRVEPVRRLPEWLEGLRDTQPRWLLSPTARSRPSRVGGPAILVLSGPEGGLDGDEEAAAFGVGFEACNLGPRILRAETAPLALLAWLALG